MKHQEDKHHQEREFHVGDWIYVKLLPHVQNSVQRCVVHKLSYKYFGPYLVMQCLRAVTYNIQLPSQIKIHPIFHVSQLKKVLPPDTQHLRDAQLFMIEDATTPASVKIINTCLRRIGNFVVLHTLVQWGDPPITWSS